MLKYKHITLAYIGEAHEELTRLVGNTEGRLIRN